MSFNPASSSFLLAVCNSGFCVSKYLRVVRTDHKGVKNLETLFFFLCNRGLCKEKSLKYFVWWFKGFDKNTKFEVREKYLKYNKNKRTRETKQEFWQGVNIYFLKIANFFVVILWANCSFMIVWCCLNMMWNTKHGICW